ncbi:MAG: DUF1614 domain-containing protein [Peptococcaceae bacterium]
MMYFPLGLIVLLIVSILIYLGFAHRVLDRMYLSDRGALILIAALIGGSFINIPLAYKPYHVSVNVGGALIPTGLAAYLLVKAGTQREKLRAVGAAVITALAIYGVNSLLMRGAAAEPGSKWVFLSSIWLFPLVAGVTAYLFGRSRRAAFVGATLGVLLMDLGYYGWLVWHSAPAGRVNIGGAGVFDAVILAGILAVFLSEIVGEVRERLQGGPHTMGHSPRLLQGLRKPAMKIKPEEQRKGDLADEQK